MERNEKIVFGIISLIMVGLLSLNIYLFWGSIKKQNEQSKFISNQFTELKLDVNKIQPSLEKVGDQISEVAVTEAAQSSEIKTTFTSLEKLTQEAKEQSETLDKILSGTVGFSNDIKKNQDNLTQIIQIVSEQKNISSEAKAEICSKITDVKNSIEELSKTTEGLSQMVEKLSKQELAKTEAGKYFVTGIEKWDEGDINASIKCFKQSVKSNQTLSGAYYNIALCYKKLGETNKACDYAYQAGCSYLKNKDVKKANRMVDLLNVLDKNSKYVDKMKKEIDRNISSDVN